MKIVFGRFVMSLTATSVLLWGITTDVAQAQPKPKAKAKTKAAAPAPAPAKTAVKKTPAPAATAQPTPKGTNPLNAKVTDRHRFTLISVEEKVSSLKEKVFRSKAQLLLLLS